MVKFLMICLSLGWMSFGYTGQIEIEMKDELLVVVNAGIKHKKHSERICEKEEGVEICTGEQDHRGDFLNVTYSPIDSEDSQGINHSGVYAGDNSFQLLFASGSDGLYPSFDDGQYKLDSLQVNLGSERYGAEYFIDLLYIVPWIAEGEQKIAWCELIDKNKKEYDLVIHTEESLQERLAEGNTGDIPAENGTCPGVKKIVLCHEPPGNPANAQTIVVSKNQAGHEDDKVGVCMAPQKMKTNINIQFTLSDQSGEHNLKMQYKVVYVCKRIDDSLLFRGENEYTNLSLNTTIALEDELVSNIDEQIVQCKFRYFFKENNDERRKWSMGSSKIVTFTDILTTPFAVIE